MSDPSSSISDLPRSRLIPQYSLRLLLSILTASGVVFSIIALALRGHAWAQGVTAGFVALLVALLVYAFMFSLLWIYAVVTGPLRRRWGGPGRSPFSGRTAVACSPDAAIGEGAAIGEQETAATPIILD